MIPADEALGRLLDLLKPTGIERVPIHESIGRALAEDVAAKRDQPPFPSSAMDGYAVRGEDFFPGSRLRVAGVSKAGRRFGGDVARGCAVRIFTGAPVPPGGDRIVIQEDVEAGDGHIMLGDSLDDSPYIRPAGSDFRAGDRLRAPARIGAAEVSHLAAMNAAWIPVRERPVVSVLMTGDELVAPGAAPGEDQIIASNGYGVKAILEAEGARVQILPIARDSIESVEAAFALAGESDLAVAIGGASDGDHDLVRRTLDSMGMELSFYKVAMRPGKPLMAGRLANQAVVGLPGNPVSAIVCAHVFLRPAVRAMLGFPPAPLERARAKLSRNVRANGPREHYMRALLSEGPEGLEVAPFDNQDSSLLSVLLQSNALLARPAGDRERGKGEFCAVVKI